MYTADDAGCYVNNARGIYMVDTIIGIATDHGFRLSIADRRRYISANRGEIERSWTNDEWSHEVEDDATEYMNDNYPVDGHYWGRSEEGDWGLWLVDDE